MFTVVLIAAAALVILALATVHFGKVINRNWVIAGLSFILGLAVLGVMIVQSRDQDKTLRVVGYATKPFESDLVKWNIAISRDAAPGAQREASGLLQGDVDKFRNHLTQEGFEAKEIQLNPASTNAITDNYGNVVSYKVQQSLVITSNKLDKVEQIALNPQVFNQLGITYDNSYLGYFYTKLPDLKKALLSEATQDAVARAKEISSAAKTRLGKMYFARAGVFQITEPYSTEVSDYGIYSTATRSKHISVTLTAEFTLR